jgi:hypothetical protein
MTDFTELQKDVRAWRAAGGGGKVTLLIQVAGASGELAGECLQSAVKLEDGRVDGENHTVKIKDGIGDTLIYLMGACDILNTTLEECFMLAWSQVQKRRAESWGKDKIAHHHYQTPHPHEGKSSDGLYESAGEI